MLWLSSFFHKADTEQPRPPISALLAHYATPGGGLPPSARVAPSTKQRTEASPVGLWRYGAFLALKATELAGDFVSHHVWGPRRRSWGIEMTLISSLMRNMGTNTHLMDITMLRTLMQIGGLAPLPADALVTPVTFRVRRRQLRGILADFDKLEDGRRELAGEWVVGKALWQRLNAEWKAGARGKHRVILYLHGGAYYVFSAATHRLITIPLSKYTEARVFAIDYRLAPETRFPGPLHDAVSAYLRLVDDLHIPPENILVAGDSAGGGLSLALLMYLRDNAYPLPAGAILMSPWVDLTMSCDSWDSNAPFDVVPRPLSGDHLDPVGCYLGEEGIQRYLTHPYASPLFGDFTGLPPLLIQAGEAEVLRDEVTLLAHKASAAGVRVQHELFEDAVHVFQMFPFLDLAREAFQSCRRFVKHTLPLHHGHSPRLLDGQTEGVLESETGNARSTIVRGDGLEVAGGTEALELETPSKTGEEESWEYAPEKVEVRMEVHEDDASEEEEEDASDTETEVEEESGDPASPQAWPMIGRRKPLRRAISSLSRLYTTHPHPRQARLSLHLPAGDVEVEVPRDVVDQPHVPPKTPTAVSTTHIPPPMVRTRTQSHSDIGALCQQWRDLGPANQTITYRS